MYCKKNVFLLSNPEILLLWCSYHIFNFVSQPFLILFYGGFKKNLHLNY